MPPPDQSGGVPWRRLATPDSTSRSDNPHASGSSGSSTPRTTGNTYLDPFPSLSDAVAIRSPSRRDRRRNGPRSSQINPYPTRESEINRLARERQWNSINEERPTRTVHYGGNILQEPDARSLDGEEGDGSHGPQQAMGTTSRISYNRVSRIRRRPEGEANEGSAPRQLGDSSAILDRMPRRWTLEKDLELGPIPDDTPMHVQLELLHEQLDAVSVQLKLSHRELDSTDDALEDEHITITRKIKDVWFHFLSDEDTFIRHFSPIKDFELDIRNKQPSCDRDFSKALLGIDTTAEQNFQKILQITSAESAPPSNVPRPADWEEEEKLQLLFYEDVRKLWGRSVPAQRRRLMALLLWRKIVHPDDTRTSNLMLGFKMLTRLWLQRLARDISSDFFLWSVTNYPFTRAIFSGILDFLRNLRSEFRDDHSPASNLWQCFTDIFDCSTAVFPAFQAAFDWSVPAGEQLEQQIDLSSWISAFPEENDKALLRSAQYMFSLSSKFRAIQRAFSRLRDFYWYLPEVDGGNRESEGGSESMDWTHHGVTIDRDNVIESSVNAFDSTKQSKMWHALKVRWGTEDVDDLGGPFKEWINLLTNELLDPANKVVEPHPEHNPEAQKHGLVRFCNTDSSGVALVRAFGYAVGLAFAHDICVHLPFPLFLFRALCTAECRQDAKDFRWTLKDLEDVDQELMLRLSDFMHDSNGARAARNIASDIGLSVPADVRSEDEIKNVIFQHRVEQTLVGDSTAFRHFLNGFNTVVSASPEPELVVNPLLSALLPVEMRAMITGAPIQSSETNLDLCSVEKHVRYFGFEDDDEMDAALKREFWKISKAYDRDQRERLLAFITGSKHLAYKWQLKMRGEESTETDSMHENDSPFIVHLVDDPASRMNLPWSSTCTATLFIPRIPCSELKPRLDISLQHYTGFGLL